MTSVWLHPVWALVLAEVSLVLGPLLVVRAGPRASAFLDGFVLASITALVTLHLLPEAIAALGATALVVGALGFALPSLVHRMSHRLRTFQTTVWLFLGAGLFIHAGLDGAALGAVASSGSESYSAVALAVILHRLPVGLFAWWTLRPLGGVWIAAGVLAAVAVATAVGFFTASAAFAVLDAPVVSVVIAFVAGSLMHVAIDHAPPRAPGSPRIELLGAVCGLATVGVSEWEHHLARPGTLFDGLWELALFSIPALALGLGVATFLRRRVRSRSHDARHG